MIMKKGMMACRLCFLLLVLCVPEGQLKAQTGKKMWTLEECILFGLENNTVVKQYELAKENQEIAVETTQFSRLPDLNANLGQTFYFGRTPDRDGVYQDQTGSNSSVGINTSVTLFNGFRINHQIKAEKMEWLATVEDLNGAKEELSLAITGYYLQVLLNRELLQIALDQLELNRQQIEQTQLLVTGGKSPESDLYEARSSFAQQQVQVTDAAGNLQLALLELAQSMNLQDMEGFDIVAPFMPECIQQGADMLILPEQVYTHSVTERPAIKAASFRLSRSERQWQAARGAYYPSLNLGAGYSNSYYYNYSLASGLSNASLADQLAQNSAQSIGLSLGIPLFNRMATRNRVRSARIQVQNQELMLDKAKQDLYKEVQQAYYRAVVAYEKYKTSETAAEAAQMAYAYEEQKYAAGRSNLYSFDMIRTRLAAARSDLAQSKFNFLFRSRILAFYNGEDLIQSFLLH
ncbi:MAG: TolC family protein [Bacteroidales bacterium]|jgi:outer membrane protein|nr:TolC family protein [Bacteroidales bacterium]